MEGLEICFEQLIQQELLTAIIAMAKSAGLKSRIVLAAILLTFQHTRAQDVTVAAVPNTRPPRGSQGPASTGPSGGPRVQASPSPPFPPPLSLPPAGTPAATPVATSQATPPQALTPSTLQAGSSCRSLGQLSYTSEFGSTGGSAASPQVCPTGSYAQSVRLTQDSEDNSMARLTGISLTCNDPEKTVVSMSSKPPRSAQKTLTLSTQETFNYVTGFTGSPYSSGPKDIISGITISSSNGASISAGSSTGYYVQTTSRFAFGMPENAQIVGLGGRTGFYFDSLFFAYCS